MHELSIIRTIFSIIEQKIVALGMNVQEVRIGKVKLALGAFSTAIPDSLSFNFEAARTGTIFEHAELVIRPVPLVIFCPACGKDHRLAEPAFRCPECGSDSVEIRSGQELKLESFDLEDKEKGEA